jgi:gliding motility-associated lipoprotein GldH
MTYIRSILLIFVLFTIVSCKTDVVFDKYEKIPKSIWKESDTIVLVADITDTVFLHDIYINVRNTGNYKYSNLFLFMSLEGDGKVLHDTIDIPLADDKGKWLGDGVGGLWDSRFIIRKNTKFPHSGKYTFKLQQGMRDSNLEEISDIGIRIEKSQK